MYTEIKYIPILCGTFKLAQYSFAKIEGGRVKKYLGLWGFWLWKNNLGEKCFVEECQGVEHCFSRRDFPYEIWSK
jgi:hypothetical protein